MSAKATALNLRIKLKKDDNFAIFTPVESARGTKATAKIGILEDLRIDAPYVAIRNINGKQKKVGILKAVDIADNCKKDAESVFRIIKGSVEKGDTLREFPWSGIFFDIGYGRYPSVVIKDEFWEGDLSMNTLLIGAKSDMGYITSSPDSEIFLRLVYPLTSSTSANIDTPFFSGEFKPPPVFKRVAFIYGGIRFSIPNLGIFADIFGSEKKCK